MNVHTPERQAHESQADYRTRQAASRAELARMTKPPMQEPAITKLDTSRFFLGQHTNPKRNAERRARRAQRAL